MNQNGGSSDFSQSFYAQTMKGGPAALSNYTLSRIENAPMFNPLSGNSVFPTPSSGVVPNGLYFAHGGNGDEGKSFTVGKCSGTIQKKGEYNYVIEGKCVGASSGSYLASSPPDFRQSYSGSGLPYPNEDVAFNSTPNEGELKMGEGGSFRVDVVCPNSYYINNGSTLVMPQVCFNFNNVEGLVEVQISDKPFIPNRSLSSLPGKQTRSTGR
jgi:hypothetical protein